MRDSKKNKHTFELPKPRVVCPTEMGKYFTHIEKQKERQLKYLSVNKIPPDHLSKNLWSTAINSYT
jgi:hypothetical protein